MFDALHTTYKKIITCIGIIGYLEEDIKKRGLNINKNLPLNCLYAYPNKQSAGLTPLLFQMMFPDNNHQIPCPKFFSLTLTNQEAAHSYLYCLKFSEKYNLKIDNNEEEKEIDIPIVIFIKSQKEDLESFKQLLHLINFIIVNDDMEKEGYVNYTNINDFKKVQLMNLFYFLFSLPHTSPHSQVKLKLDNEIKNSPIDSIDFYFSSNCEIPCNKNDTDINILFLLLDQSIIIKVLFAILTEKQIVFRATQAYLLNLIIPTFLKLIFPFKWLQSCITVLPKENLDLLEAPGSFIFGVLSDVISLQDLMREYPGKIIIDCDTNEIFGDSYLEPYEPPKFSLSTFQQEEKDKRIKKDKGKKDKDNKENKELLNNINFGNSLTQGNNLINIGGSFLYKYENDPNAKKTKFIIGEKNNIIIDTQNSQLLIDKTDAFIDSREWKWLRRNIQLVRNPEIFDLDNISNKKNDLNGVYLNDEDDENIILPNRSFSYNIQNILMKYFLNKLSYSESEFMSIFKNTNLFLSYNEPKKYQNNAGKKIAENIMELKNQQRNLDNCFNIEYSLKKFKAQNIINKIDEKLSKNNKDINSDIFDIYNKIKTILNNYKQMENEEEAENFNNYDGICESERNDRKSNLGPLEGRKSELKKTFGRITKFTKGHERNKTSVLQETIPAKTNFLLMGVDNSVKGIFKFYNENGFLEFINNFENFVKEENINIKEELYEQKIIEQMIDIILKSENIFGRNRINSEERTFSNSSINSNSNNNKKGIFKKRNTLTDKEKKKKEKMHIIPENDKEEEENDLIFDGRGTVIRKDDAGDFDFASNLMNNISYGLQLNLDGINDNKLMDNNIMVDEDIISFPNFKDQDENNDNSINEIKTENDEKVNHKSQFYLFIALILEEILENNEKANKLIEEINNYKNIKINVKELLLKIYRLAYKYSGIKHRDFPYFSYYSFLSNLDLNELNLLKKEFDDLTDMEVELYEIYGNVILEKEKVLQRKEKRKTKILKKVKEEKEEKEEKIENIQNDKKIENIRSDKKIEDNKRKKVKIFQDLFNLIGDKVLHEKDRVNKEKELLKITPININSMFEKNEEIKINESNTEPNKDKNKSLGYKNNSIDTNPLEFNCLISYAINTTSEFECKNENFDWKIIKLLSKEISELLPKNLNNNNSIQNFLDETHSKLMKNKNIFNLIGQLRYIDPGKIRLVKERMCFWLNCFNYLIIFTFFYKKWNIIAEKDWKYFFKNVKYYIGENYYSFHDMQYIIYKKILFFPSTYKITDNLKKFRVSKADDAKNFEKKYPLLYNPFVIYVPIKGFLKPIIYDENQLENQFNQRIKEYFANFVSIDYQNNIILPELLLNYNPNFLYKEHKKFQALIPPSLYESIKDKKYKTFSQSNFKWKINFDNLFNSINKNNLNI